MTQPFGFCCSVAHLLVIIFFLFFFSSPGRDTFKGFPYQQSSLKSCQFCYFPCGDELIANGAVIVCRTKQHLGFESKMCETYVEGNLEPDKRGKKPQPLVFRVLLHFISFESGRKTMTTCL